MCWGWGKDVMGVGERGTELGEGCAGVGGKGALNWGKGHRFGVRVCWGWGRKGWGTDLG